MQDSDMMRNVRTTYVQAASYVGVSYSSSSRAGTAAPASTAHGMLIASDQAMCALPQDQYQANFTQVWLNVSLVPIEGFHCHLRMRVIDDDSVYVP